MNPSTKAPFGRQAFSPKAPSPGRPNGPTRKRGITHPLYSKYHLTTPNYTYSRIKCPLRAVKSANKRQIKQLTSRGRPQSKIKNPVNGSYTMANSWF